WVPVTVTARNGTGADFTGTVVLRLFQEYAARSVEWHRDFTVEAGGEADAVFYVPASQGMAQAELLSPDGSVAASVDARVQFRDGIIAAVVASSDDTLRLLAGIDLRAGQTR